MGKFLYPCNALEFILLDDAKDINKIRKRIDVYIRNVNYIYTYIFDKRLGLRDIINTKDKIISIKIYIK